MTETSIHSSLKPSYSCRGIAQSVLNQGVILWRRTACLLKTGACAHAPCCCSHFPRGNAVRRRGSVSFFAEEQDSEYALCSSSLREQDSTAQTVFSAWNLINHSSLWKFCLLREEVQGSDDVLAGWFFCFVPFPRKFLSLVCYMRSFYWFLDSLQVF